MQRAANKIPVAIILLLMGILFYGCGTGDILDENNQRYLTDVSFSDAEEDDTLGVDVNCLACDVNATTFETCTDLFADIRVEVPEGSPGLQMTGYKISFKPLRSYDLNNNAIIPPSVATYHGSYSVVIPTESEVEFRITCMEYEYKLYLGNTMPPCSVPGDPCDDFTYRYEVTIRMDFVDEYGQGRDLTVKRTLYFGRYDNC